VARRVVQLGDGCVRRRPAARRADHGETRAAGMFSYRSTRARTLRGAHACFATPPAPRARSTHRARRLLPGAFRRGRMLSRSQCRVDGRAHVRADDPWRRGARPALLGQRADGSLPGARSVSARSTRSLTDGAMARTDRDDRRRSGDLHDAGRALRRGLRRARLPRAPATRHGRGGSRRRGHRRRRRADPAHSASAIWRALRRQRRRSQLHRARRAVLQSDAWCAWSHVWGLGREVDAPVHAALRARAARALAPEPPREPREGALAAPRDVPAARAALYGSLITRANEPNVYALGFPWVYIRYTMPALPLLFVMTVVVVERLRIRGREVGRPKCPR